MLGDADKRQLDRVVTLVRDVLGADAVGAYLLGSAVPGGLQPVHRAVLARARAIYLGGEEERWDDVRQHVRPHADHVVGEINRLR